MIDLKSMNIYELEELKENTELELAKKKIHELKVKKGTCFKHKLAGNEFAIVKEMQIDGCICNVFWTSKDEGTSKDEEFGWADYSFSKDERKSYFELNRNWKVIPRKEFDTETNLMIANAIKIYEESKEMK